MWIRPRQLFFVLILAAIILTGCTRNVTRNDVRTTGPAEVTPSEPTVAGVDNPEEEPSQTDMKSLHAGRVLEVDGRQRGFASIGYG